MNHFLIPCTPKNQHFCSLLSLLPHHLGLTCCVYNHIEALTLAVYCLQFRSLILQALRESYRPHVPIHIILKDMHLYWISLHKIAQRSCGNQLTCLPGPLVCHRCDLYSYLIWMGFLCFKPIITNDKILLQTCAHDLLNWCHNKVDVMFWNSIQKPKDRQRLMSYFGILFRSQKAGGDWWLNGRMQILQFDEEVRFLYQDRYTISRHRDKPQ